MKPTKELRFVERDIGGKKEPPKYVNVLQQKWKVEYLGAARGWKTEWRDVPLEKEK